MNQYNKIFKIYEFAKFLFVVIISTVIYSILITVIISLNLLGLMFIFLNPLIAPIQKKAEDLAAIFCIKISRFE
jgi:hypothetical protein